MQVDAPLPTGEMCRWIGPIAPLGQRIGARCKVVGLSGSGYVVMFGNGRTASAFRDELMRDSEPAHV